MIEKNKTISLFWSHHVYLFIYGRQKLTSNKKQNEQQQQKQANNIKASKLFIHYFKIFPSTSLLVYHFF